MKNLITKILPLLALTISFNTHSETNLNNDDVVGEFSSRYDLHIAKNSCNGATYKSELHPLKLLIKSKSADFFDSIESFTVTAGGVTSYAIKEDNNTYFYKNFLGEIRHYEQFNLEKIVDGETQFTLTTYPYHGQTGLNGEVVVDIKSTNGSHKLFTQDLSRKKPIEPPKEYVLDFEAKIIDGELITKLENDKILDGNNIKVTYRYSINDDAKKYEVSKSYNDIDARSQIVTKLTHLDPTVKIDSFSYLGIHYDYVDQPIYDVESKVELYDSTKEFFNNMIVNNDTFCF